jgi:uracil-DNA glycosylase
MSQIQLTPAWLAVLQSEFDKPYMQQLKAFLQAEKLTGKQILPRGDEWFAALNMTDFPDVRVVILGQDPYPSIGHAHGLCFSVRPEVKPLPKSLLNIYQELKSDLGIDNFHQGYLAHWAKQGVLLLNAVLTVEAGKSNSHQGKGWEQFTDAIIQALAEQHPHLIFVLWGSYAQKKGAMIDRQRHHVIASAHPSPLSAYRGFFGSRPFSRINQDLQSHAMRPIDWQLPTQHPTIAD